MVELADAGGGLYRRNFAGDTFNTAWYARKLLPPEWTVGYASCIGTDAVSDEMRAFMEGAGIDTSTLRRLGDRTVGLYMISLDRGERSFSYWRGQSAARALADDPAWLDAVLEGRSIVYVSGITLAILAPEARARLCAALSAARGRGATVAFDTNLRPKLWESREAMQQGMRQGASVADVVLPSFDEETALFGDGSPADTIARYRDCGARMVVVKNGAGEVTLWDDAGGSCTIATQTVREVVDTTAAGDSFAAGFLSALATGQDAATAVRSAAGLAARVIQARGALVPEALR